MLHRHHHPHNKDVPENNWTHVGSWEEVALGVLSKMHQAVHGGGKVLGPWDYVQNCNVYYRALPLQTINQCKKKKKEI